MTSREYIQLADQYRFPAYVKDTPDRIDYRIAQLKDPQQYKDLEKLFTDPRSFLFVQTLQYEGLQNNFGKDNLEQLRLRHNIANQDVLLKHYCDSFIMSFDSESATAKIVRNYIDLQEQAKLAQIQADTLQATQNTLQATQNCVKVGYVALGLSAVATLAGLFL